MTKDELKNEIKKLKDTIKKKDEYIKYLENLNEAYSKLEEIKTQELIEADKTIKAHESIEMLSALEKREAEEIIRAHESLISLSALEKREADELIKAQETITDLSVQEIMQKDRALEMILNVNKEISAILSLDTLLREILESLIKSLNGERGILFLKEGDKLDIKLLYNIDKDGLNMGYFKPVWDMVKAVEEKRESVLMPNMKINYNNDEKVVSAICIPLIYENEMLGILYADRTGEQGTFIERDLYIAQIFGLQAAISINNARMYDRIKKQNEELLKLVNLKKQFIAHVSDNLKSPVEAIINSINKLTTMDIGEEAIKTVNIILGKLKRIDNTINKVITISALEREVDELFKDEIDFESLISGIIEHLKPDIEKRSLTVSIDLKDNIGKINANLTIIRTIFDELISNAILYNKPDGSVIINGYRKGNTVVFEFIDTGYGIKEEDIENIFMQFYRTQDSPQLNERGAGLGLYMVKTFLEHYNGNIQVESKYGSGSKFVISLFGEN